MSEGLAALILLIAHLLGDFYFQPSVLAEKKKESYVWLVLHALIYAAVVGVAGWALNVEWWLILAAAVSHWLIDTIKWKLQNKPLNKGMLFSLDQAGHLLFLFLILRLSSSLTVNPRLLGVSDDVWRWIACLLLIGKPANISLDCLFERFAQAAKQNQARTDRANELSESLRGGAARKLTPKGGETEGAGATIGIFERVLTVLFASVGQYGAMGLLMAAKSMARYDKISKSPAFAEYYLIGTLYSILFALAAYLLVFKVFLPEAAVIDPMPILLLTPSPLP